MTYEEIVDKVRGIYEDADARMIFEHVAIQINIVGEGSGILYLEVAHRQICVEPYDYYDRDGILECDATAVCDIFDNKLTVWEALDQGRIHYYGNWDKLNLLKKIVKKDF